MLGPWFSPAFSVPLRYRLVHRPLLEMSVADSTSSARLLKKRWNNGISMRSVIHVPLLLLCFKIRLPSSMDLKVWHETVVCMKKREVGGMNA